MTSVRRLTSPSSRFAFSDPEASASNWHSNIFCVMLEAWAEGRAEIVKPIRPSHTVFIIVQRGLGPNGLQSVHSGFSTGQFRHGDGIEVGVCVWDGRYVCGKLARRVSVRRARWRRIFVCVTDTVALRASSGNYRFQRVRG